MNQETSSFVEISLLCLCKTISVKNEKTGEKASDFTRLKHLHFVEGKSSDCQQQRSRSSKLHLHIDIHCPHISLHSMLFSLHPRNLFYYTNNFDSRTRESTTTKKRNDLDLLLRLVTFCAKTNSSFTVRVGWQKRS